MEGFIFYDSFYKALSKLELEEQARCYKALCEYALYGVLPNENDGVVSMFFELVKPQIDKNRKRYENGCKGGRPKETKLEPNNNQTITKPKPNNNQKIKTEKSLAVVKPQILSPQQEVFNYFAQLYKQEIKIDYLGRNIDYINLAKLIKRYGVALVKQKINWLLTGCKHSIFWFSKDINDFNISTLTTHWDRILPKLTQEQKKEQEKAKKEYEKRQKVIKDLAKQGIVFEEEEVKQRGIVC